MLGEVKQPAAITLNGLTMLTQARAGRRLHAGYADQQHVRIVRTGPDGKPHRNVGAMLTGTQPIVRSCPATVYVPPTGLPPGRAA